MSKRHRVTTDVVTAYRVVATQPPREGRRQLGRRYTVKAAAEEMCSLALRSGYPDAEVLAVKKRDRLAIT